MENKEKLIRAARDGDLSEVKRLVQKGVNPNSKDVYRNTALIESAQMGRYSVVKWLISNKKTKLNIKNSFGAPALNLAVYGGHAKIVRALIEANARVGMQDNIGYRPVMAAAEQGDKEILQMLLDAGAWINVKNKIGRTPLMLAITEGKTDVVKFLVDEGADLEITDNYNNTAIMLAVKNNHLDMIQILIKDGANINVSDKEIAIYLREFSDEWEKEENTGKEDPLIELLKRKTIKELREYTNIKGHNGLMTLTLAGKFNEISEKVRTEAENNLSIKDLILEDNQGRKIVDVLGAYKELDQLFDPKLWIGKTEEMKSLWQQVAERHRDQVDFKELLSESNRLTVQQLTRKRGR